MVAITLMLLLLILPVGVEAAPIDISATVGDISVGGFTLDVALAADCLPGVKCQVPVKRKIELMLPKEPASPPNEPTKVILVPSLPPELQLPIENIKKQHSPKESALLFELLKEELLHGNLDDFAEEFTKTHLTIGFKNAASSELSKYESLLEELIDGLRYKGEASFVPGFVPLGAALILFNPQTEEGAAAVTLFAVPLPAALVLVALGLLILPRRRSGAPE